MPQLSRFQNHVDWSPLRKQKTLNVRRTRELQAQEAPEVDFSPPLASYFLEALMHSTYVI
jgi:hypothetical protein